MCPFWNSEYKWCKVSPSDSQCYKNDSEQQSYCLNSRYTSCANYEAYQRGDYKIQR